MLNTLASMTLTAKKYDSDYSILDKTNTTYDFIPMEARKYIENITEHRIEDGAKRYTENLISQAKICIKSVGKGTGWDHTFEEIPVDVLTTQCPNAIIFYFEKDQSYAIGIDTELFTMLEHILLACIHIVSAINEKKEQTQKALRRYMEIVFAYVQSSIYKAHVKYFKELIGELFLITKNVEDGNLHKLVYLLRLMALNFIITHELGHIACGHFNNYRPLNYTDLSADDPLLSTFKHEQEYQADEWSYRILTSLEIDKQVKVYMTKSFQLLFSILSIIERLYQPKTVVGRHIMSKHPKASERLLRLRHLSSNMADDGSDYGVNLLEKAILMNLKMAGTIQLRPK